jgi:diadenosine tetraphosphate (Ap4A) HIT family hydrolase
MELKQKGDCLFCKIARGEIPCAKIWENEGYLAFLDINPNVKGMALVIPKSHHDSYLFDMKSKEYLGLMSAVREVAGLLDKKLHVKRTAMVMEGLGVNHAHVKLYLIYGLEEKFKETWAKDRVFFDKYEGYISTQLGPQANIEELNKLAKEIRGE